MKTKKEKALRQRMKKIVAFRRRMKAAKVAAEKSEIDAIDSGEVSK